MKKYDDYTKKALDTLTEIIDDAEDLKVKISAIKEPITNPVEASELANASTKLAPSKKPPVYIIDAIQATINTNTGRIRSITFPFLPAFTFSF